MENDIESDKNENSFESTGNVQETVGLSREQSASLETMVEQENITDVIVSNDDVIISQNVLMSGNEISHSSEETLSINEDPTITKRECIELDVNSSMSVSSSSYSTFSRKPNKSPFTEEWKEAAQQSVLHVHCRKITGELHKSRFGSGAKGKSIRVGKVWFTPSEFEAHCGRSASKDWKRSIRFQGQTLQTLIEERFIQVHAPSCSCAVCLEDSLAAGPIRLYQQCKRRRRTHNTEETKVLKRCVSEPFTTCETSITLPVSELNQLNNPATAVSSITEVAVDISGLEAVAELPLDKAWDQMNQVLVSLEKGTCKAREMLEALRERTNREMEEQRRVLLQEKEEAVHQAKLEAHLSSIERPTESEFLVEVRSTGDQSVGEETSPTNTLQPVMLDALTTSIPNLCQSHIKKKCVNCNRESCSECSSCRRRSYCSVFCQRRDWPSHRDECSTLRSSPAREVPGYIFMLSD